MQSSLKIARVSIISNLLLLVLKLGVGVAIGSIAVISEGVHSSIDLVASGIAYFSVRTAQRPADETHPFGHGKFENMSALVESMLIAVAALLIVFEALAHLATGGPATSTTWGLVVVGISGVANVVVSQYLIVQGRRIGSQAIEADGKHLRSDVWTSAGVFVGLLLVRWTGLGWLDPVAGLVVAAIIIKAAWDLFQQALNPLTDARLPAEEENQLRALLDGFAGRYVEYHDLRTRMAGSERHVDLHLVMHRRLSFNAVHDLCDEIEAAMGADFPGAHILIHPEPCEKDCPTCSKAPIPW